MKKNFTSFQKEIDHINFYDLVNYEWNLKTDVITWRNVKKHIQNIESNFLSGNHFIHHIDHQDFWSYIHHFSQLTVEKNNFDFKYQLNLSEDNQILIQDQGKLIFSKSEEAISIVGSLKFLEKNPSTSINANFEGYDKFTGSAQKAVFNENLMAYIDQAAYSHQPTAYIMVAFDQIMSMICEYQLKIQDVATALKKIMFTLHNIIVENHFIGHISGHCIGIIVKNCNEKNLNQLLNNINSVCQNLKFYMPDQKNIPFKICISGNMISLNSKNIQKELNKIEKQFFKLSFLNETSEELLNFQSQIKKGPQSLQKEQISLNKIQKMTPRKIISAYLNF